MANKRTRAVSDEEYSRIIDYIQNGFALPSGKIVKPNRRIAAALVTEANLGMRIGDIVRLRLCDIVYENGRYHLDSFVESKTKKVRTFVVPTEFYIYLQNYALEQGIKPTQRLFDLTPRAIQKHLKMVCDYIGYYDISTHSFRKKLAQDIYNSTLDINLVKTVLQHSSTAISERYLGVTSQAVENALKNHLAIPA